MAKRLLLALVLCFFATSVFAQDRLVFTRPDGSVSVVVPAPNFLEGFDTLAEGMAAVHAQAVPSNATDVQLIDSGNVPVDRTYRNDLRRAQPNSGLAGALSTGGVPGELPSRVRCTQPETAPSLALVDLGLPPGGVGGARVGQDLLV